MKSRERERCEEGEERAKQSCLREGELGETSENWPQVRPVAFRFLVLSAVILFLGTRSLLGA
jgi:hypothetical protein